MCGVGLRGVSEGLRCTTGIGQSALAFRDAPSALAMGFELGLGGSSRTEPVCKWPKRRAAIGVRRVARRRRWLLADGTNNAVVMLDFTEEAILAQDDEEEEDEDDDDIGDVTFFT